MQKCRTLGFFGINGIIFVLEMAWTGWTGSMDQDLWPVHGSTMDHEAAHGWGSPECSPMASYGLGCYHGVLAGTLRGKVEVLGSMRMWYSGRSGGALRNTRECAKGISRWPKRCVGE